VAGKCSLGNLALLIFFGKWGSGEVGKWGSGEVGRINKTNLLSPDN